MTRVSHREWSPLSEAERKRLDGAIALVEKVFTPRADSVNVSLRQSTMEGTE